MKKCKWLPLLAVMLICTSCFSLLKTDVEALKATKKVALISMYGEGKVDFSEAMGGQFSTLTTLAQMDNYDLEKKIPWIKKSVLRSHINFPFKFVPEKKVIRKRSYKKIDDKNFRVMSPMKSPRGYKILGFNEKEKIKQAIGKTGADAGLIVTWGYKLNRNNGLFGISGSTKLSAHFTFCLVGKEGNIIFNKTVNAQSDTAVTQAFGITVAKEMPKMINEATSTCMLEIAEWLRQEI